MTVTGVDFVSIPTTDIEASTAFYRDVLGLELSSRWGSVPAGQEFETGTVTLALLNNQHLGIPFAPITAPIALQVDDVHAERERLEAQGVEFLGDTIDSGVCHMANFADPDGNALMFHHRYAPRS
jgi:catechol 2,3-dioxygenase-like lactoylglutathione lyase family enzyme